MGAVVVTLPAQYLGSRWSLAYYSILGVMDLVARDEDDYVAIALRMGMDVAARADVQRRIEENIHKLFHQPAAVAGWTDIFLLMARRAEEKRRAASATAKRRRRARKSRLKPA